MVYEVKLALICYMTINAAMDSALTYSASWLLSYTYFTSRRKFESFVPTTAPGSKKKIHQPMENQKPFYRLKWQHHKKMLKQINVLLNQPCCAIRDLCNTYCNTCIHFENMQGSLHFWIGRNYKPHIIKIHKSRIRTHKRVHYVLTERYFDDGVVKIPQGLTLSYFVVKLKKKSYNT